MTDEQDTLDWGDEHCEDCDVRILVEVMQKSPPARVGKEGACCAQHLTSLTNWKTRRNLREISATKKHIQCTFIEKELLGFLWFEIILYKQRLIELFGSYVVTIHHRAQHLATTLFYFFISVVLP
ncbi:hypothetical protein PROFUN_04314 [Planoprotostelium fungivorum]|uniref:Uncharacterized protein n=1 Tax=Planoprotostelium fungivorum TaxID=1890364 RepID=A0A2P6NV82_9EUKA|nr:hypothetical protein PROFUN_04314 [Planoprotostelium fungivorum]